MYTVLFVENYMVKLCAVFLQTKAAIVVLFVVFCAFVSF